MNVYICEQALPWHVSIPFVPADLGLGVTHSFTGHGGARTEGGGQWLGTASDHRFGWKINANTSI